MSATLRSVHELPFHEHPPITLGQTKRALEWCASSEKFRNLVETDPARAGAEYDLGFNPEILRPLYDPFFALESQRNDWPLHPAVQIYREWFSGKTQWRDEVKAGCAPDEPRLKAWRDRQVRRSAMESGAFDEYLIHTPVALELADGCSVGCWFCGVGATKFVGTWPYAENQALWRGVLTVLRDKIGSAARHGFCYWATDPLDNPDYERFASDFADILGLFPQTTTAQADKDPERVRRLLKLSEAKGCRVNRFSVLTERLLQAIFEAHTPDELTNVEIVAQMREGTIAKADAGAFRKRAETKPMLGEREVTKMRKVIDQAERVQEALGEEKHPGEPALLRQPGTIACVSGFLFNMIARSVKLISPCVASDSWPLGYIVFAEAEFEDAEDLERIIDEMIDTHMPSSIEPDDLMRFVPVIDYERVDGGFRLSTARNAIEFVREDLADYVSYVGDMVHRGEFTAAEIAGRAFWQYSVPEANTMATLEGIFRAGLLVDKLGVMAGEAV